MDRINKDIGKNLDKLLRQDLRDFRRIYRTDEPVVPQVDARRIDWVVVGCCGLGGAIANYFLFRLLFNQ